MRNVSVSMKTGNVCLISTIKAELITREERDSQALASGRKAMDSVTEMRHLLSGSPCLGASAAALKLVGILVGEAGS